MSGTDLVAVGDPDGSRDIARAEIIVVLPEGAVVMDRLGRPGPIDIMLTGVTLEEARMHLSRGSASGVRLVVRATGVAVSSDG